jgi:hypothetical protein
MVILEVMKKLLLITPHMSTGGCPRFVLKKVELLSKLYNITVVEWSCHSHQYVVHRNKVMTILNDNFISLGDNKTEIIELINTIQPNYIMFEEIPETFISEDILTSIYNKHRLYSIFETTHSKFSTPNIKKFYPDKFIFVSPYSIEMFKPMGIDMELIDYPINYKKPDKKKSLNQLSLNDDVKHVINIGLFTKGKNQGYCFEIAKKLLNHKIMFHFIGNTAINFKDYWEPLLENKPENCIVWGEREDVDTFIQMSDVHLFTSTMELNPLSVKESLEYGIPTMIFKLNTYMGMYDNTENINYLTGNIESDIKQLLKILYNE